MKIYKAHLKKGGAMLIAVVFFLITSSIILTGVSSPIIREVRLAQDLVRSKQSLFAAESGIEDVTFRSLNAISVSPTENIQIDDYSAITTITSFLGGKDILSEGEYLGYVRKVTTSITEGSGVAFNYGIQVGAGGFELYGSSGINGNVYANGSIISDGTNFVTGSAVAANSIALSADQVNDMPSSPPDSIVFRNASASQDLAQSFVLNGTGPVNKVSLYMRKAGNPSNATVRIAPSSGSNPGNSTLASGTLNASQVTGSYGWVDITFSSNPNLTAGTTYWIIIDSGSVNAANYFTIGQNTAYGSGTAKVGQYNGSWNNPPSVGDAYFKVFIGGLYSVITGDWNQAFRVGTSGVGDAWAHTVSNSNIAGTNYCQSGSGNNKSCNTSKPDPVPTGMPVSDANIEAWKEEAESGGEYNGNYLINGIMNVNMGPRRINGNLTISQSGVLNLTGTIHVTGNLTVTGAGKVRLSSAYGSNSGIIVADGRITIDASGAITGSGTPGSYIMVLTTSNCPTDSACGGANAINITGAAGSVVLVAQNGTVNFGGSAAAKSVTAHKMIMTGATTVSYESGIADATFTEGPSGGFNINSWEETQ